MKIINAVSFNFSNVDENAWTLFLIGFTVVFVVLIIIYLIFDRLPHILKIDLKSMFEKKQKIKEPEINEKQNSNNEINQEVYVAIAMALALHLEDYHDEENMNLTINLKDRLNSQWNTKIQNIDYATF
ncbi:MAG: OadG family protein [Bacteroidales bacterium]|nr:OadG family protein [Bacteroidales bacterium]